MVLPCMPRKPPDTVQMHRRRFQPRTGQTGRIRRDFGNPAHPAAGGDDHSPGADSVFTAEPEPGFFRIPGFYENDENFADLLHRPQAYAEDLKRFPGMISPDCSLYRDMPLCLQIVNTYRNRAVGHYFRRLGMNVIPNVRWGDERSYEADFLPEKFAFLGVPENSIVAVGTYGCIKSRENREYFRAGLAAMLETLKPRIVLVYGAMPESVFGPFAGAARFVRYPDWIRSRKGGR